MFLIIVGTGAMGKTLQECAVQDKDFHKVEMVEPLENKWPEEKADLIVDFSHPGASKDIYEYCRKQGGNIPVIIGTTGQTKEEESIIKLLEKICPVERKSNFSRGIAAMNELAAMGKKLLPEADIEIEEIHHTKKFDSPSGTAKTLCSILETEPEDVLSIRMGTVFGKHKIYMALEDEVLEICHTAYSKKIFARGALEAGKKLIKT